MIGCDLEQQDKQDDVALKPLAHYELALHNQLQCLIETGGLEAERRLLTTLAQRLNVDAVLCAAALLHVAHSQNWLSQLSELVETKSMPMPTVTMKMVRYRLAVGHVHLVSIDEIKRVLVEESGVDKKNITIIAVRDTYTLIELPDAMPSDIFQHLKTVEINQQPLDIKRVKLRNNKKRHSSYHRRNKQRPVKTSSDVLRSVG